LKCILSFYVLQPAEVRLNVEINALLQKREEQAAGWKEKTDRREMDLNFASELKNGEGEKGRTRVNEETHVDFQ
jgi:hypothetical protein